MKVIIAGSRTLRSQQLVKDAVVASGFKPDVVVCGGASGIDWEGAVWAKEGKRAGPLRNEQMAKYADALILIWTGKSPGSRDMLKRAKRYALKIHEVIVP